MSVCAGASRGAMSKLYNSARDIPESLIVALFILAGAVARLIWTSSGEHLKTLNNESHNIATSLALKGEFADAFYRGSGISAHIGMLTPIPSSLAYKIFGIDTASAEWALVLYATAVVSVTFWLCWKLARKIGTPLPARVCAIALLSLTPLQFGLETREGRAWEVNLAALGLIWVLNRIVAENESLETKYKEAALTGAASAFLFILSPPAGLAASIAMGLFEYLNFDSRRLFGRLGAFLLVLTVVSGFWAFRNFSEIGDPIPLRDNFGLELDIANYPGAVNPINEKEQFLQRITDIHPVSLGHGLAAMKISGGEARYYKKLGAEAKDWIIKNPINFAFLTSRHLRQFFFPPSWFWGTFGGGGQNVAIRLLITWCLAATGLISLVYLSISKANYLYVLSATIAASIPYAFVQPTLRYRYLISTILIFVAFDGAARCFGFLSRTTANRFRSRIRSATIYQRNPL